MGTYQLDRNRLHEELASINAMLEMVTGEDDEMTRFCLQSWRDDLLNFIHDLPE